MTTNALAGLRPDAEGPATSGEAITPDDETDLERYPRALYVGAAGDLNVVLAEGQDPVLLKNVPAGAIVWLNVKRVLATDTSAQDLLALF